MAVVFTAEALLLEENITLGVNLNTSQVVVFSVLRCPSSVVEMTGDNFSLAPNKSILIGSLQ